MIDIKSRLKNKAFLASMISAIILLIQQLGLDILPDNINEIVNTLLLILSIMGIVVDPSTEGLSDRPKG